MGNLLLAFTTGLTSGGLSCATVQGGLIVSAVSDVSVKRQATTYFLLAKLFIYTVLGAVLGLVGQGLTISSTFQGYFQIFIGLYMIATAARLLNLHPLFRYTIIKPPLLLIRQIRKISKGSNGNILTPIILGISTIFIPCGVTQAMLILSIGSGSYLNGALIMFFFTLGTMPIFYIIGMTAEKVFKNMLLTKIAAFTIIFVGLVSINNGQVLRGSLHTYQNYAKILFNDTNFGLLAKINNNYQEVEITVTNNGYKSNVNQVKLDMPVKLILKSQNVQSCARSFVIPSLGINELLPVNGVKEINFIPKKVGQLLFSCGMGMYTGTLEVIE